MNWRYKYFARYTCPVFFKGYLYLRNRLSKEKKNELEKVISEYGQETKDEEIKNVLNFIKKNKTLDMYNYDFCKKYLYCRKAKIKYDREKRMYFVMHLCDDGVERRLYFAESISNPYMVRGIYNCLLMENDFESPHRYLNKGCNIPVGGSVADVGAQEGLLGLNNIEAIKYLYLFECDKSWIRALEATFEPWRSKVYIIPKFVGDTDNEEFVRLDTYFADKEVHLIKMDIEGWEVSALNGGSNLLREKGITWAVCSYHQSDDEQDIINIYKQNGMKYTISDGLVYIKNKENAHSLRHALVWGKH